MSKHLITTILMLAAATVATATVTVSVDLCDAGDGIALPANNLVPGGIAMVDVFASISFGAWTASGVCVQPASGVTLRYATDPNTGAPIAVNPGTANRFVTFFSRPRGRDSDARYENGEAMAWGRYSPGGATPEYSPTR